MSPAVLSVPRATVTGMGDTGVVDDQFVREADQYRRELLAHCYRMLGSVHDAEDLVQETYLRAWRAYDKFEGRSSMRTWLYRIATNTCLTALESKSRREMPTDLAAPEDTPGELVERREVPWLEPIADAAILDDPSDPATITTARETTRLAMIAALQHLPATQRAVLLLRETLRWRAAEVADLLGISTAAVNSALQRARARLDEVAPQRDEIEPPSTAEQHDMLKRWLAAYENYDVPAIVELLKSDAVWEMPPFLNWTIGAENIGRLIKTYCPAAAPGDMRMVPTTANTQPAFGLYMRDPADGVHRAFQIQVLELTRSGIAHAAVFFDQRLFAQFGLPAEL